MDDLVSQIKKIDIEEVKAEFDLKVEEIKNDLSDLDKEKALAIAKEKGIQLKKKAEELVALAKKKGTPVLIDSAQDVLENVVKVSKDAIKKLESKRESE